MATLNTLSSQSIALILAFVKSFDQLFLKISNIDSRYGKVLGHPKRVANRPKLKVEMFKVFLTYEREE
jgi:hypothetical protein